MLTPQRLMQANHGVQTIHLSQSLEERHTTPAEPTGGYHRRFTTGLRSTLASTNHYEAR